MLKINLFFKYFFFGAHDIKICWTNQFVLTTLILNQQFLFKALDKPSGGAWQQTLSLLSASQERRLVDEIIFDATLSACANSDQWQQAMVLLVQADLWRVTRTMKKNGTKTELFWQTSWWSKQNIRAFLRVKTEKGEWWKYQDDRILS